VESYIIWQFLAIYRPHSSSTAVTLTQLTITKPNNENNNTI